MRGARNSRLGALSRATEPAPSSPEGQLRRPCHIRRACCAHLSVIAWATCLLSCALAIAFRLTSSSMSCGCTCASHSASATSRNPWASGASQSLAKVSGAGCSPLVPAIARKLRAKRPKPHGQRHLDETRCASMLAANRCTCRGLGTSAVLERPAWAGLWPRPGAVVNVVRGVLGVKSMPKRTRGVFQN